ncbi:MAG: gliding motility-associated ABC transporter substrate-binding protein GldG [Saprospiraceae bacterium]
MPRAERALRTQSLIQIALVVAAVVLVNVLANSRVAGHRLYTTFDLTEDSRFTLTPKTEEVVEELEDVIFVRVLMEGEFPAGMKRVQTATRELLEDLRSISSYVEYEFSDPSIGSEETVRARYRDMAEDGIQPVNLTVGGTSGTERRAIFPYAIVNYAGRREIVSLLEQDLPGVPDDVTLSSSVSLLEYKFSKAIRDIQRADRPIIAFTTGQGELEPIQTADLENTLRSNYEVGRLDLDSVVAVPLNIKLLIVARPTRPFSEKSLFKLDQYIMNGGSVIWSIDQVNMSLDSLRGRKEYYPVPYELGLEDLFFRYGFRLENDLVMDLRNTRIPLQTGRVGNGPQYELFPYPYNILALSSGLSPIVKTLDPVNLSFASTIDLSVEAGDRVKKTVLLHSSRNSRFQRLPVGIDLNVLKYEQEMDLFTKQNLPVALLLEGRFSSFYTNRLSTDNLALLEEIDRPFRPESPPDSRMIVVADGDLLINPVTPDGKVLPLGVNRYEKVQFANKDFVINAIEYLMDDDGVILSRGKEIKIRLLDRALAQEEAGLWRIVNVGVPLLLLAVFGGLFTWWRRRRFGRKSSG